MSNVTSLDEYRSRKTRKIVVLGDFSTFDVDAMILELTPEGQAALNEALDAKVLFNDEGPIPEFVHCLTWINGE